MNEPFFVNQRVIGVGKYDGLDIEGHEGKISHMIRNGIVSVKFDIPFSYRLHFGVTDEKLYWNVPIEHIRPSEYNQKIYIDKIGDKKK